MNDHSKTYPSLPLSLPTPQSTGRGIFKFKSVYSAFYLLTAVMILHICAYWLTINIFREADFILENESFPNAVFDKHSFKNRLEAVSILGYFFVPVSILIKLTVLTLLIQLPLLLNSIIISFRRLFEVVVVGGIINAAGDLARAIRLYYTDYQFSGLLDVQFVPFGLLDLINTNHYSMASLVLFNYFNLFELGWIVVVFAGLSRMTKVKNGDAFMIVCGLWILCVLSQWAFSFYLSESTGVIP